MADGNEEDKDKTMTYAEAMAELEEIVKALDSETVNVDELSVRVGRAEELCNLCQSRLRNENDKVSAIIKRMQEV